MGEYDEPWAIHAIPYGPGGEEILVSGEREYPSTPANRRRVVAAVNAAAGVSQGLLERAGENGLALPERVRQLMFSLMASPGDAGLAACLSDELADYSPGLGGATFPQGRVSRYTPNENAPAYEEGPGRAASTGVYRLNSQIL